MNLSKLPIGRGHVLELKPLFEGALQRYPELIASAELNVERWEYATSPIYDLDPLQFLQPQMRPGQVCDCLPQSRAGYVRHGFTSDGRLVFEQRFTKVPENCYRTLYIYKNDSILSYAFHHTSSREEVSNCSRLIVRDSVPVGFQRWGSRGWYWYTYECSGDHRLSEYKGEAGADDECARSFSGRLTYKDKGIVEVWEKAKGDPVPWQRFRGKVLATNPFWKCFP